MTPASAHEPSYWFYTPPEKIHGDLCLITGEEHTHLARVLRKGAGDVVWVVDGAGTAYRAVIEKIERREARCRIEERFERLHEPDVHLTLGAAVLKNGARFDTLVEKVVELGAASIVPLSTQRTIPRHARRDRWQKIALAAMKQSGRSVLPTVAPLTPLDTFLRSAPGDALRLIPHEKEGARRIKEALRGDARAVVLCVGPEGGFAEEEVAVAEAGGFLPVLLGDRRLRSETAAIVAAGIVLSP